MIDLPPLPDEPGLRMIDPQESLYNADQMRSYGEACARAALEAAARECEAEAVEWKECGGRNRGEAATDCAEAIRALKVAP